MTTAQYREQFAVAPRVVGAAVAPVFRLDPSNLIQLPSGGILVLPGGMNKTEQAYARHLQHQQMAGVRIQGWYFEPCKWELPHSAGKRNTFTPDFLVRYEDGSEEWVEIKAGWRKKGSKTEYRPGFQGDGRTKLVTFAGTYPHLRVVLRWFHPYHSTWQEEIFNADAAPVR